MLVSLLVKTPSRWRDEITPTVEVSMKRFICIVVMLAMVVWCSSAMAQDNPGDFYQLIADDFGYYFNQQCALGEDDTIPGFCFQPNFLPVARLFRAPDGTLNMTGNGELTAEVDFATDWAGNAVSPHRDYQKAAFTKYEDPQQGTMVPQCMWMYDDAHSGGTGVYSWSLGCTETRPTGYEGTSLQCETLPYMADFNDGNGMVGVADFVCEQSGIFHVPANLNQCGPGTTDNDCDGIPNDTDNCPDTPGDCPPPPPSITIKPEGPPCYSWAIECQGYYHWTQMGSFDAQGVWKWDSAFVAMIEPWAFSNPNNSMFPPSYWTPTQTTGGVVLKDKRFDRRQTTDGDYSMVLLDMETGDAIAYPRIWKGSNEFGDYLNVEAAPGAYPDGLTQVGVCPNLDGTSGFPPFSECDGTNPNVNGGQPDGDQWNDVSGENPNICCRPMPDSMKYPHVELSNNAPLDYNRVNSIFWTEKQAVADEFGLDGGSYLFLEYNSGTRSWKETGGDTYGPQPRWRWPGILADLGPQSIVVTYDTDKTHTVTFNVTDVRDLPAIPLMTHELEVSKVKKNGKVKEKVKEVDVLVIKVREVINPLKPDEGPALIVQWPEPDEALFGGMQLRLYVGTHDPGNDDFLFVDAPATK